MYSPQLLAAQYNKFTLAASKFVTKILYEIVLPREESQRCDTEAHIVCTTTRIINHMVNYIGHETAAQTLAVNTRTVLAIVPPQGCEAILVEILQSKRSARGPHFTCFFLKSE